MTRIQSLGYSAKHIEDTVKATSAEAANEIINTFEESLKTFKAITHTLREHCGQDAPPQSNISNILDEVLRTSRFLYKDKIEAAAALEKEREAANKVSDATGTAIKNDKNAPEPYTQNGTIIDREDALRRLEEVAKYFRQFEPHTPIAPGLDRIVSWGRLSVSELMMQLLPDDQSRGFLFTVNRCQAWRYHERSFRCARDSHDEQSE